MVHLYFWNLIVSILRLDFRSLPICCTNPSLSFIFILFLSEKNKHLQNKQFTFFSHINTIQSLTQSSSCLPSYFLQNCCIMSLTLLDEFRKPFKCVCSPVSMELEKTSVCLDYNDQHFLIHHKEPDVQVKMELAWSREQEKFVLISLVINVSVQEVNKHFSRDY